MNSKPRIVLIAFLGMAVLVGCTHFHQTLTGDEKTGTATNAEDVRVFFANETPTQTYEEVGYIVAQKGTEKEAMKYIKTNAAKMGADALLNCEVHVHRRLAALILFIPIFANEYIASGVAVKYTKVSMKGE